MTYNMKSFHLSSFFSCKALHNEVIEKYIFVLNLDDRLN